MFFRRSHVFLKQCFVKLGNMLKKCSQLLWGMTGINYSSSFFGQIIDEELLCCWLVVTLKFTVQL